MISISNNNLFWKIVIFLLLLTITGEIIYYIVYINRKNSTATYQQEIQGSITKIETNDQNISELVLSLEENTIATTKFEFTINKEGIQQLQVLNLKGEEISNKELREAQSIILKLKPLEITILN